MDSSSSDNDLVEHIVAKLKKQGQLSVETVGQILNAVSDNLTSQSSNDEQRKVTVFIQAKFCSFSKDTPEFNRGS